VAGRTCGIVLYIDTHRTVRSPYFCILSENCPTKSKDLVHKNYTIKGEGNQSVGAKERLTVGAYRR
jgi:hypothetical protein